MFWSLNIIVNIRFGGPFTRRSVIIYKVIDYKIEPG